MTVPSVKPTTVPATNTPMISYMTKRVSASTGMPDERADEGAAEPGAEVGPRAADGGRPRR